MKTQNANINTTTDNDSKIKAINSLMIKIKSDYDNDNINTDDLYTLANIIVLAELKNTIDPGRRKMTDKNGKSVTKPTGVFPLFLYNLKNTVWEQVHQLTKKYDDDKTINDYTTLNKKGDIVVNQAKLNADLDKLYHTLHNGCLNDGSDLIQSTVLYLLEELDYMKTNNIDSFETVRQERVPNKKVYIKAEDSANYWRDIDICGIQSVYKKLRSEINGQKAIKESINNNYAYFRYEDDDMDNNKEVYVRVPLYSTLISADVYGLNTVSQCDYEQLEQLIKDLKLSNKEELVLNAKLTHSIDVTNGHRAIATYLGVTDSNVKVYTARIKKKMINYINECEVDEQGNPVVDELGTKKYKHNTLRELYYRTVLKTEV